MKKLIIFILVLGMFFKAGLIKSQKPRIILFYGQGCSHCLKVERFLEKNHLNQFFEIEKKEIYFHQENRKAFEEICEKFQIPLKLRGVPLMIIENHYFVGDKEILEVLEKKLKDLNFSQSDLKKTKKNTFSSFTLPLVLGAAFVDAINPCAFAILIILLATLLTQGSLKKVFLSGLSFVMAIYFSYLMMGLGIYQALASFKLSYWFKKIIGISAMIIGILNLKDFFYYGKGGFVMEVPLSWRPKLKRLIQSITSPLGAFLVGLLVSLFLLPCTSGPYLVILGMLSYKKFFLKALALLLLYNFVFILPMIGIIFLCAFGFSPQKLERIRQKRIRMLHLIGGLIMIIMGLVIITLV